MGEPVSMGVFPVNFDHCEKQERADAGIVAASDYQPLEFEFPVESGKVNSPEVRGDDTATADAPVDVEFPSDCAKLNQGLQVEADEPIQTRLVSDFHVHVELRELGYEIESYCAALGIAVNDLCPVITPVVPVLPDGTIYGNWPMYRQARLTHAKTVQVFRNFRLDWDDHDVTLRALTSVSRKGYEDPLLLGLVYRRWRGFEDCMISQRQSHNTDQWYHDQYGMSLREHCHKEFTRRLGRSIRELQRLASILDVPAEWLRLHRDGVVPLSVLERFLTLSSADQDDLMEDLRADVPVKELVYDYGLKPDRRERRLQNAMAGAIRKLRESADLLEARLQGDQ